MLFTPFEDMPDYFEVSIPQAVSAIAIDEHLKDITDAFSRVSIPQAVSAIAMH